jgi:hypothetical protein
MARPGRSLFMALAAALAAGAAFADGSEGKQEFRDGDCLVKREWKKDGAFKEEVDCAGGRRDRGPDRKTASDDGDCKVEREWKKDGGYKSVVDCRPRRN